MLLSTGVCNHLLCMLVFYILACQQAFPVSTQGSGGPSTLVNTRQWQAKLHHLSNVHVSNQRLSNLLGSILNHQYSIPELHLRRGVVYTGANSRLRRVVRDLLTGGKPVKIGAVGGSVSWGQGASIRGETDWFSIFSKWLIQAFPQANITARNGCVPGTPSSYMVMCLELSADDDVDLMFSEYILNDGNDVANRLFDNSVVVTQERLFRRILRMSNQPAIISMQIPSHGMAYNRSSNAWQPFYRTAEDALAVLAQYYDTQQLSLRTAVYRMALNSSASGVDWQQVMCRDLFHPGDLGHKIMADLAVWLIQQTAISLLLLPFDKDEAEFASSPLPPPMYAGNEPPSAAMCLYQDLLKPLVVEAHGFEFVNEGTEEKPKKGFVALQPGSQLVMKVDTQRPAQPDAAVPVMLAYMKSYLNMGMATVGCASGCLCDSKEVDAHHNESVTQVYLAGLSVTQHPECVIRVQVLGQTRSNGTKFKVSGLVVSERPASDRGRYDMPDGQWGMEVALNKDIQAVLTTNTQRHNAPRKLQKRSKT